MCQVGDGDDPFDFDLEDDPDSWVEDIDEWP